MRRLAWAALFVTWATVYGVHFGPTVFLWGCCVGNGLLALGSLTRLALWPSLALLLAFGPQVVWVVELVARAGGGPPLVGATETLFDEGAPAVVRVLTCFHVVAPVVGLRQLARLGFDRRALPLALLAAPTLLLVCQAVAPTINFVSLGVPRATLVWALAFIGPTFTLCASLFPSPRARRSAPAQRQVGVRMGGPAGESSDVAGARAPTHANS